VFYQTPGFEGRNLLEISCSFQEESAVVSVKFTVGSSVSTRSEYIPHLGNPIRPLAESLTMLTEEALNIAGGHEFHIHADKASTRIHITHGSDAS